MPSPRAILCLFFCSKTERPARRRSGARGRWGVKTGGICLDGNTKVLTLYLLSLITLSGHHRRRFQQSVRRCRRKGEAFVFLYLNVKIFRPRAEALQRQNTLRVMALIDCPECGGIVSTTAPACPHCGAVPPPSAPSTTRVSEPQKRKLWPWVLGFVVLAIIAVSIGDGSPSSSTPESTSSASQSESAAALLQRLREVETGGDAVAIVEAAEAITRRFPGTPEADSARAVAAVHEEAAEAERQRRAEEAEHQRLALKWRYNSYKDEMTSRSSREARVQSENTVNFDSPYDGSQHGTLVLRDHPSYGQDVILRIERGQILCRSYQTCTIRVRFDEGEAQSWRAVGPADNSSTTIFLRNQGRFRQRMRSAQIVRVRISVYQQGEPTFEFHVGGFDQERFEGG